MNHYHRNITHYLGIPSDPCPSREENTIQKQCDRVMVLSPLTEWSSRSEATTTTRAANTDTHTLADSGSRNVNRGAVDV